MKSHDHKITNTNIIIPRTPHHYITPSHLLPERHDRAAVVPGVRGRAQRADLFLQLLGIPAAAVGSQVRCNTGEPSAVRFGLNDCTCPTAVL